MTKTIEEDIEDIFGWAKSRIESNYKGEWKDGKPKDIPDWVSTNKDILTWTEILLETHEGNRNILTWTESYLSNLIVMEKWK